MTFVAPFCGLRFNPGKIARLEDVVTPPYDVINDRAQAVLELRNPYNMIKLDISKSPGLGVDSEDRYNRARNFFRQWQADQVLIRDQAPAIYLYLTNYSLPSGRRLTRRGFVALVRLADFSEGIVKPHEQTFATVTSDRLRLLDACQAQFSQVFAFYSDARGEVMAALEQAAGGEPLAGARDADGALHKIWPVRDPACLAAVQRAFINKAVYIADGHHRYSTALKYREQLRQRQGELAPDSPYNFVMMYLCAMEDPGLSVLPTHRLLYLPVDSALDGRCPTMARLTETLAPAFELEEIESGSREALVEEVLARMEDRQYRTTMFGLYHAGEDRCLLLALKEGAMERLSRISRQPALQNLDVVVLSDLVVDRILGLDHQRCEEENLIHYYSDPDEAVDEAIKASAGNNGRTPLLFLMNHTQVAQVKMVADDRLFMPHKSTFFYPKPLTGLLINKLGNE